MKHAFWLDCILRAASAQTQLGTITGTITAPAGAVVPNASIEAKNNAIGAVYPAASSGTGNYTVGPLPLGTYAVSVNVMGFKKYVRTGVTVDEAGGIYDFSKAPDRVVDARRAAMALNLIKQP